MEKLPKFVVRRLALAKSQEQEKEIKSDPHPDANLLAAFAERSLAEAERSPLMQHLALCGDCREIVAFALPEVEDAVLPLAVAGSRPNNWFRWPAVQWGAVAAGVLAVSLVAVQTTRHPHGNLASTSGQSATGAADLSAKQSSLPSSPVTVPAFNQPKVEAKVRAVRPARHHAEPQVELAEDSTVAENQYPLISPGTAESLDIVKAKDPVVPQSGSISSGSNSGGANSSASSAGIGAPAPTLQTSPVLMMRANPRWEVTASGSLQRSFDGGNSWEAINPIGSRATDAGVFRAISASGLEVWVGGSAGTLYHTADGGNHWSRITPSDGASTLTGDIISILSSDALHGSVSTSSGEEWTTEDAGQTWRRER
jgi:hypothetical protein